MSAAADWHRLRKPSADMAPGRGSWEKGAAKATGSPRKLLETYFPPMLATLATDLPGSRENWLLEMKYDGFRAIAAIVGGEVAMWTRNALDLSSRFPHIAEALAHLKVEDAVIDGEIVALDASGAPRFQLLQQGENSELIFVFDLLRLNGHDLRSQAVEARRSLLEMLLKRPPKFVVIAEQMEGDAKEALDLAAKRGYEGLIAKQRGSRYEGRRSKAWLKLKAVNGQELAIVGFNPSTALSRQIGSLLLGVIEDGELRFAGKVGTGFSARKREELRELLLPDQVSTIPVKGAPRFRDATWVKPKYVAQVQFTEWTDDGRLRHPSFLGLRPDKKPAECVREKPSVGHSMESGGSKKSGAKRAGNVAKPKAEKGVTTKRAVKRLKGHGKFVDSLAAGPTVILSKPERIFYPRDGFTKKDVADYFSAVSSAMIHALDGRPIAMEHWNDGIEKPSWYQQNIGKEAESWMTLVDTKTRTSARSVRHLIVDRPDTLQWLAQHAVLTTHMWSSRAGSLESPDWLVFDLDPAKGKGIEQAVDTALVLRKLFESMGLPSVPKTSGKRGIHILVPIVNNYSHEQAVSYACTIADAVAGQLAWATTERPLAARKGRLYLDCLQNGYGKTIVAPYSLRAIDGAPVSAPLKWSEVTKKLDPAKYNLRTMPARLAKVGDLFAAAVDGGVKLPKLG
ncbi:MAG TPA: DNA ligase D [Thermoanaerobaculia bacterium]|nr:DNA ligase D [Thermoanaerobaculia bacterium]